MISSAIVLSAVLFGALAVPCTILENNPLKAECNGAFFDASDLPFVMNLLISSILLAARQFQFNAVMSGSPYLFVVNVNSSGIEYPFPYDGFECAPTPQPANGGFPVCRATTCA